MSQPPVPLDDLAPEVRNALPFGVVLLDAHGVVHAMNPSAAELTSSSPESAQGRSFFLKVAPSTRVPTVYGRFRDGLRRGRLNEVVQFVLGTFERPVRTELRMTEARAAGRYWVELRPVARLNRETRAEAAQAVERRVQAGADPDEDICAREPIHVPGAIQPHAALLAFEDETLRCIAASANCMDVLGMDAPELIGRSAEEVLAPPLAARLASGQGAGAQAAPVRSDVQLDGRPFVAMTHRQGGRWIVELEPAPQHPEDFGAPSLAALSDALAEVRAQADMTGVAQAAAAALKALTGFERVLIYRFDRDWNGEAVAEARDPDAYDSLLGLRFPASDVPAQARALYLKAPARFVVDRDYAPAPLIVDPQSGNAPLDLSLAASRSLSPIHLEYQRNLGVNGSMSSSIIVEGRLWGLAIGHHRTPHYLAPETRAAVALLTDTLGLQLGQLALAEKLARQEQHMVVETGLLERMAGGEDFVDALLGGEPSLLDLFGSKGAAIVEDGTATTIGLAPSSEQVCDLARWLAEAGPERVHAHEALSQAYPPAADYAAQASGVLAAFTGEDRRRALLWFKPEEASAVAWGGDPHKAVETSGGAVLPRRSFDRWVEERRGASTPWPAGAEAAASGIAEAVESVARRQNRRISDLSAALEEKESLLAQKEMLTREIDHRVMNSLQIVGSFVQMQARLTSDPETRAAFDETYGRVMSVARIHDSLYRSEDVGEVDIGHTIEQLCRDLAGMAGENQTLEVRTTPGIKVPYQQALAISLIASELVTNALKYAYEPEQPGAVEVDIRPQPDRQVCLTVSDQGRGLPEDWATGERQSGLGMKLIRAMLQQVNGDMRVENGAAGEQQRGARFVVCA